MELQQLTLDGCVVENKKICSVEGCGNKGIKKGLCNRHYTHFFGRHFTKICRFCGKEFIGKINHRFCSSSCSRFYHRAEKNSMWKGGMRKSPQGYVLIYAPEHHFANEARCVLEHRLVYEEYYKCSLLSWGVIHHINGIKYDNRIENLPLMGQRQHSRVTINRQHQRAHDRLAKLEKQVKILTEENKRLLAFVSQKL